MDSFGGLPIKTSEDIDELRDKGVCIVIYGSPGSGKTPTAANVVRNQQYGFPGLLVDCAGGTRSVTHLVKSGALQVVRPESWDDLLKVVQDIRHKFDEAPFKSYIFDNLTEMANMRLMKILREGNRTVTQIQDWNVVTMDILSMVRTLRDASNEPAGPNVIMTAWETANSKNVTGVTKRDVGFNPALAEKLPGIVDMVGHLTVWDNKSRRLSFEASDNTAARFRRPDDEDPILLLPDNILYTVKEYPIAEMVGTLRGGEPFPAKYKDRK